MGVGISGGGPRGAHKVRGRALHPCGQLVRPPGVFFALEILKYSKRSYPIFRAFRELLFSRHFFIAWIIQKTDRKYYFCLI